MKKILILTLLMLTLLSSCTKEQEIIIRENIDDKDVIAIQAEEEQEKIKLDNATLCYNYYDNVYIATIDSFGSASNTLIGSFEGRAYSIYTPGMLKIKRVFKGKLKKGDKLDFYLPYGIMKAKVYVDNLHKNDSLDREPVKLKIEEGGYDSYKEKYVELVVESAADFKVGKSYLIYGNNPVTPASKWHRICIDKAAIKEVDLDTNTIKETGTSIDSFAKEYLFEDEKVKEYIDKVNKEDLN